MKNLIAIGVLMGSVVAATPQTTPADYDGVLKALGKQGDFKSNALKINIPRNDLKVKIDGIAAVILFAHLAAILSGHSYRLTTLLGKSGVIYHPCHHRVTPQHCGDHNIQAAI